MYFFKYINVPVFIISLALGLFVVYITVPDARKIYVYPTHDNVNTLQYKDQADMCFSFNEKEVPCPENESDISKIPQQV